MKTIKSTLSVIAFFLLTSNAFGQSLDKSIYSTLARADSSEFVKYANSIGYNVVYDSTAKSLFAKSKGFIFMKLLVDTGNAFYRLAHIVSTLEKANNKIILQNARLVEGKTDTWIDDKYLYIEWDAENAYTKEMWYKVMVYQKK